MSVQAMTAVFEESTMRGNAKLVLLAIANYHSERGCWPSVDRIARDASVSRRTAERCIAEAERAGELQVNRNAGPSGTNVYTLHLGSRQIDAPVKPGLGLTPELKELALSSSGSSASQVGNHTRASGFAKFWIAYPRKRSKADALKAFNAAVKKHGLVVILSGLERALSDFHSRPADKVPYPGTWLRAEGFLDEPEQDSQSFEARLARGRKLLGVSDGS